MYLRNWLDTLASILLGPIKVNTIVRDYLVEMNLSWHKAEMNSTPSKGYDPTFVKTL